MKKLVYYIPPILLTVGVIVLSFILKDILTLWYVWVLVLWLSSILLSKNKIWGSIPSIVLATYIIIMGTQNTNQTTSIEIPLGIMLIVYYAVCSIYVWKSKKKTNQV